MSSSFFRVAAFSLALLWSLSASAADLKLQDLIQEVIKNNPEIQAAQAGVDVAQYKIPQAGALPDPMVMVGYQNDGYNSYTFGEFQFRLLDVLGQSDGSFLGETGLKGRDGHPGSGKSEGVLEEYPP